MNDPSDNLSITQYHESIRDPAPRSTSEGSEAGPNVSSQKATGGPVTAPERTTYQERPIRKDNIHLGDLVAVEHYNRILIMRVGKYDEKKNIYKGQPLKQKKGRYMPEWIDRGRTVTKTYKEAYKLKLKPKKIAFDPEQIICAGFTIDRKGEVSENARWILKSR